VFERFTPAAKALVIEAQAQRSTMDDRRVRSEHILLALLAEQGPSGEALRRHGFQAGRLLAQLEEIDEHRDDSEPESDDRLLKGLGIEVEAIRRSIDETFGPGALDRARGRHHRRNQRGRRNPSTDDRRHGFDPASKRVLELSLREALRLKTRHIGPEHIGLGILNEGNCTACRLLSGQGIELAQLRASWEAIALGASAH